MAIGEFDYDDNFKGETLRLAKIIFIIFLIDISLVMMNIVIGLAVTDVGEIIKKTNTTWLIWWIKQLVYENLVSI